MDRHYDSEDNNRSPSNHENHNKKSHKHQHKRSKKHRRERGTPYHSSHRRHSSSREDEGTSHHSVSPSLEQIVPSAMDGLRQTHILLRQITQSAMEELRQARILLSRMRRPLFSGLPEGERFLSNSSDDDDNGNITFPIDLLTSLKIIKKCKFKKLHKKIDRNEIILSECPICLEKLEDSVCVGILQCKHYFHLKCIEKWTSSETSCPLCRGSVF